MNRHLFLTLLSSTWLLGLQAQQPGEHINLAYKNASYDVFIIRLDSFVAKGLMIVENTSLDPEDQYFQMKSTQAPFFCITAGVVDSVCGPLGLCIEKGQQLHALNSESGNGNFFLKPNGVLSIDSAGHVQICTQENYVSVPATEAIQSGPMLLIKGKPHSKFDPKSVNKNIRCGVGISKMKGGPWLVFAKSNTAVSFYEFAELFRDKYQCEDALNLESGGLSSMHLPTAKKTYSSKIKVCRYLFLPL